MKNVNRLFAFLLSLMLTAGAVQMPVVAAGNPEEHATVETAENAVSESVTTETKTQDIAVNTDSVNETGADDVSSNAATDEVEDIENKDSEETDNSVSVLGSDPLSEGAPEEGSDQTDSAEDSNDTGFYDTQTENPEITSMDLDDTSEDTQSSSKEETDEQSTEVISYTITLDANGGYFENEVDDILGGFIEKTDLLNKVVLIDESIEVFPTYSRGNQIGRFLGWSLEPDGELVSHGYEEFVPEGSCVLYAKWEVEKLPVEETEDESIRIQGGGEDDETILTESEVKEEYVSDSAMNASEAEFVDSGTCGIGANAKNVRWKLTKSGDNLTLTISGQGEIAPFKSPDYIPWRQDPYRTAITSLIIEDGVTEIAMMNFADCTNMINVSISNSVTKIGVDAFAGCSSLTNVAIPDSVKSIEFGAFSECSSLTSAILPKGLTCIEDGLFYKCSSLTSITLPDNITCIEEDAFSGCSSLKNIIIPNSVTSIGGFAFNECTSLKSIMIPNGVKTIEEGLCADCSSLLSITIPESVTEIAEYSFPRCTALESFIIPANVKSIGDYVFEECESLRNIYFRGNAPEFIASNCFQDVTAFAHYPERNASWTNDVMQDYGGHLTWLEGDSFPISQVSMSLSASSFTYTGTTVEPTLVVKKGNNTLVAGTHYTVSYKNNTNAGIATVTITGIGQYTGTKSVTFKINKAEQSIKVKSTTSKIVIGKTATISITAAQGKKSFESSDSSIATVNASTGVVTGKKAGTVIITAVSAATANYNAASKTIKFMVTPSKPGNCRFVRWNNAKYNSCQIAWDKAAGADGYQTVLSWTDGSHDTWKDLKGNELKQNCSVAVNHVSQFKVRAYVYTSSGRVFSEWSNLEYITPSPTTFKYKKAGTTSKPKAKISWNIIYGCDGYNVFLTTNPKGTWYWNQSTPTKATATSVTVTKYRGARLKKGTRYYVRIVTRRKRNGVFCTVPMPSSSTCIGSFKVK